MNLAEIPLIDQHGHNLLRPQVAVDYPYAAAFTQGYDPEIINHHAHNTLELLAEQLIVQTENFATFFARFLQEIDPPPAGVVAFKSIVCYRTGLLYH